MQPDNAPLEQRNARMVQHRAQARRFFWPMAGVIMLTMLICGSLLAALVMRMDLQASNQMRRMMEGALNTRMSALAEMTRDYGRWDPAVLNLYGEVNQAWAVENLSNATHVIIFNGLGRTVTSVGPDGSRGVTARQAMPAGLHELLRQLPRSVEGARALASPPVIITQFQGSPTLVAAMPIIPYSDAIPAREPLRYVAITQALDETILREWQASFALSGVRLEPSGQPGSSVQLQSQVGERLGAIVWDPVHPGRNAALALMPYLAFGFFFLAFACALLGMRANGVLKALASQTAAADESARIAAANLDLARQAQLKAEAAQMRAETLANKANTARREVSLRLLKHATDDEDLPDGGLSKATER